MVTTGSKRIFIAYHVDNVACGHYVENFHDTVVETVVGRKEVKIAANKNDKKQFLRLQGYPIRLPLCDKSE